MFEVRPSPSVSVTSPDGRSFLSTSSPRRGLSKLRRLTQSRAQPPAVSNSSDGPRTSRRLNFARSVSYNESRHSPPTAEAATLRRSASRPDNHSTPPQSQIEESRRSRSASRPGDSQNQTPSSTMARHRNSNTNSRTISESRGASATQTRSRTGLDGNVDDDARTTRTNTIVEQPAAAPANAATETGEGNETVKQQLPQIRFFPHQENRNGRQSLPFSPIARTLPNEHAIIRIGRYSEREGIPTTNPTVPSDAPVGFKSKVVSRKHCEFSFSKGQWWVRDVCSSSGTFLNHIRLSQPNLESKLFPVKDGDIVQLGIDFRGGEEMIFRCVKIRVECNRSWQKRPNNFNMTRHQQLQSLGHSEGTGHESRNDSNECAICLGRVMPCQSLFVAACAHTWHYKCIRPMIEGKNSSYPHFQCPNCRAWTDLSTEVDVAEEDVDEWMENAADAPDAVNPTAENSGGEAIVLETPEDGNRAEDDTAQVAAPTRPAPEIPDSEQNDDEHITGLEEEAVESDTNEHDQVSLANLLSRRQASNPAASQIASMNGINIPSARDRPDAEVNDLSRLNTATPDPAEILSGEGPLTPRNNAGPFILDGSAGRPSGRRGVIPAGGEGFD